MTFSCIYSHALVLFYPSSALRDHLISSANLSALPVNAFVSSVASVITLICGQTSTLTFFKRHWEKLWFIAVTMGHDSSTKQPRLLFYRQAQMEKGITMYSVLEVRCSRDCIKIRWVRKNIFSQVHAQHF